MPDEPDLVIVEDPSDDDRQTLLARLRAFNDTQVGPLDVRPVAILLKADGVTSGGLSGRTAYNWLFVEYLIVPEELRGRDFGTRLMQAAEDLARQRNCIGVWLDTFSFQARGFYEKRGYSVIGTIDDYPIGHQRFFLSKRL